MHSITVKSLRNFCWAQGGKKISSSRNYSWFLWQFFAKCCKRYVESIVFYYHLRSYNHLYEHVTYLYLYVLIQIYDSFLQLGINFGVPITLKNLTNSELNFYWQTEVTDRSLFLGHFFLCFTELQNLCQKRNKW